MAFLDLLTAEFVRLSWGQLLVSLYVNPKSIFMTLSPSLYPIPMAITPKGDGWPTAIYYLYVVVPGHTTQETETSPLASTSRGPILSWVIFGLKRSAMSKICGHRLCQVIFSLQGSGQPSFSPFGSGKFFNLTQDCTFRFLLLCTLYIEVERAKVRAAGRVS